jgi:hypothetical protein
MQRAEKDWADCADALSISSALALNYPPTAGTLFAVEVEALTSCRATLRCEVAEIAGGYYVASRASLQLGIALSASALNCFRPTTQHGYDLINLCLWSRSRPILARAANHDQPAGFELMGLSGCRRWLCSSG